MAREMREVWVVRGAVGNVIAHVETEAEAATWRFGGNTIERLPLLTPHDAAVLEAAEKWASAFVFDRLEDSKAARRGKEDAEDTLYNAIRARRAANVGGER
jgi:hypothetical protein